MSTILPLLRAWFDRLHPRKRHALEKRRLEAACRLAGCTRMQARSIVRDYFDDAR